ncbi:MAG: glutamate--tRNA ligase [Patescibacteria group bacterium]|nr:glutamate--tRNA ligase [Patescibacteria group bacterium]
MRRRSSPSICSPMSDKPSPIRVRIAPSPTGYLHIGTARTALFNWLFARKHGGSFIFRIEDTDLERSEKRFEDDIVRGLTWLGLTWDEGPFRQTERLDIYEQQLNRLIADQKAYYCECTKKKLDAERAEQQMRGEAPKYAGTCRDKYVSAEQGRVIRFRMPENETVSFTDLIRGPISFETGLIGDIVIAKNTRTPLYNFAVVVDDADMRISHVIRGEDHIANTPKQIMIGRALGFPEPHFAHLPLILDPDRSKMSKRHSATSVDEYRKLGYLPEALVNFIALLGWHPSDDAEKMTADEIIAKFDISRIQKSGAVFDVQKLNWLNAEYIKQKSADELYALLAGLYGDSDVLFGTKEATLKLLEAGKVRMEKLSDYAAVHDSFMLHDYGLPTLQGKKNIPVAEITENLSKLREMIRATLLHEFTESGLQTAIMPFADNAGRAAVLWPLRVALSGEEKSPGPFEIMAVIGKDESLRRIELALAKLTS